MRRIRAICKAELPEAAPGERCPKCLLELGLGETMKEAPGVVFMTAAQLNNPY